MKGNAIRPPRPLATPPLMRRGTNGRMTGFVNIVAYPTESFYALGVDATNPKAIQELFRVKHREKGKPIALIAGSMQQVQKFFYLSAEESKLARKYWPGTLTLLLKPKQGIAAAALAAVSSSPYLSLGRRGAEGGRRHGSARVGVRVPAHAQARKIAMLSGAPITATSANISGQPPTKSAAKVKRDFPGILMIPGRCGRQTKPSTVVAIRSKHLHTIRSGSVHPVRSSLDHNHKNMKQY